MKNIIILGGGLAGTFLAAEFCRRGDQVTLIDDPRPGTATRVAGGLFNVITGRKAVKTWLADELLESMKAFFDHPDFAHLQPFLHLEKLYRPFKTIKDLNDWTPRVRMPEFRDITELCPEPIREKEIHNPLGGLFILPCGWAETAQITDGIKQVLVEKYGMKWSLGELAYTDIQPEKRQLHFEGETLNFEHLVFAEGVKAETNPWFNWVDLRPLKGQILEVEIPGFDPGFILSNKVFLLHKGNQRFVCGSTYEREFSHPEPTQKGVDMLSGFLRKLIHLPFEIVKASAGIRPSSPNRRPIIGTHPEHICLHMFNGLGTKGWLQAPWFSTYFVQHFEQHSDYLMKDVRVSRFLK